MNRYAILNNDTGTDGVVENVALASAPANDGWVLSETANIGDSYIAGEFVRPVAPTEPELLEAKNVIIKINGNVATPFNGIYFCNPGDTVEIAAELRDQHDNIPALTIPVPLKMPLMRHANGHPTDDEIYLNVTLNAGVMSTTGTIPRSGDWKILTSRNNEALKVIGADWKLSTPDVTFIA